MQPVTARADWGVVFGTAPALPWPYGPFCRSHALEACRMATFAKARRSRDPGQVWRSPLDLLPPHNYREGDSWDGQTCWACHLEKRREPLTLNRLLASDPIGWGPAARQGRGRPTRRPGEVLTFLRHLEQWLDEQQERPKVRDFAAHIGMDPSTVRRWLRAGQRYRFSVQRKWSRVISFRAP
jgi:hypothetical protein